MNKDYEIKADLDLNYEVKAKSVKKDVSIAISPSGNQYKVDDLGVFLSSRGFATKTVATKAGWRFK